MSGVDGRAADPSRCIVETPDGQEEATAIIDRDGGMVRVTAYADGTWSVVTLSPHAARELADELLIAAAGAEEEAGR